MLTIRTILKHILFSLPLLFLLNCGEDEIKQQLEKAIPVKTVRVQVQSIGKRLSYSGTVEPIERVRLSTKLMGWIQAIYYDEGDEVRKGTPLVKLRSKDLEAKQAQAEAARAEAEAQFQNAEINLRRIESLYKKKAATQKELDDIRTAYAGAEARKNAAMEMKNELAELLRYTSLASPFDGVVTRKFLEVGDLANPGQIVMEIENVKQVNIVAKVPESQVRNLKVGMVAAINVQASNLMAHSESFVETIDQIVPSADPVSRQFDVKVLMDNKDGKIKSGMFARMTIGTPGSLTLLVPQKAIFRRGQLEGLFIVDLDGKAYLRWIRTGITNEDQIEILSGLNPGEEVVIENISQLIDGQTVEVVP